MRTLFLLLCGAAALAEPASYVAKLHPVPVAAVKIGDGFWGARRKNVERRGPLYTDPEWRQDLLGGVTVVRHRGAQDMQVWVTAATN